MVPSWPRTRSCTSSSARRSGPTHQGYGPQVRYITFPWSNERPTLRTLSEHAYAPLRLPRAGSTCSARSSPRWSGPLPASSSTSRPCTRSRARGAQPRRPALPAHRVPAHGEGGGRRHHQLGEPAPEVETYLDVDPAKLRLIPEAVDHDLFRPGDRDEAAARLRRERASTARSCSSSRRCGRTRTATACSAPSPSRDATSPGTSWSSWAARRTPATRLSCAARRRAGRRRGRRLGGRGPAPGDGALLPGRRRVRVPVVQRDVRPADPRGDGLRVPRRHVRPRARCPRPPAARRALADPEDPASIAAAIVSACGDAGPRLRGLGPPRAAQFTWAATAKETLEVYREVHATRGGRR